MNQRKGGVILSLLNTSLNMLCSLLLIPILVTSLTDANYAIYKVMQSFAGPLIMLNLGVSTIVARCVARCNAKDINSVEEKENTLALAVIVSIAMAALVIIIGYIMRSAIPRAFGKTYTIHELELEKKIFMVFVLSTGVHIISDVYRGCVQGREKFIFLYGANILQTLFRFALILALLKSGFGALEVALVDLVVSVMLLVALYIYGYCILGERPKLHSIDKAELSNIATFSFAILLQAIVNQVNSNVDIMILGAVVIDKSIITMYSSALSIYAAYNALMTSVFSVYLPRATKLIEAGADGEQLTDFVIGPGRIQATLGIGILCAFALFGKNFISIWIGRKYINAYYVTLMLIMPVTIPLVENTSIAILDAKLKRLFRSVLLLAMAAFNVVVSILLVKSMGFWGTAIGTCLSIVLGDVIVMNVYYRRVIGLNVFRMFKEIFSGIIPSGILATLVCVPLAVFLNDGVVSFASECVAFCLIYFVLIWFKGLSESDKDSIIGVRNL